MADIIEFSDISVTAGDKTTLQIPYFNVKYGEVHAIVGAHAIDLGQIFEFLQGEIEDYDGRVIFKEDPEPASLKTLKKYNELDYLTEEGCLFPGFTVLENIYIKEKRTKVVRKKKRYSDCSTLCKRYGIELNLSQDVLFLSKEDGKFVELLSLYTIDPDIIILYETLNHIEKEKMPIFTHMLSDLKNSGKGIIYLTTKVEDALRISDRMSVINNGRLTRTFLTEKVNKNPKDFMYTLLGYENADSLDVSEQEMFESIIRSTEVITSNFEMKKILEYFEKSIMDVMKADYCEIALFGEAVEEGGAIRPRSALDMGGRRLLREKLAEEKTVVFNRQDMGTAGYLANPAINMVVGTAIEHDGVLIGNIMVGYRGEHHLNKSERLYLSTFSQELLVAIETSRLMGRSVLLQESHHRIKNNLQVIINLLYIQKTNMKRQGAQDYGGVIDAIVGRIKSIAVVHDLLSGDRLGGNIVNLKDIIQEIAVFYNIKHDNVELSINNANIPYNKMISVTLVINELLSNCSKHAFAKADASKSQDIKIMCTNEDDSIYIRVEDNGRGFPEGFDFELCKSTGMHIVRSILMDLRGTPCFSNKPGGGSVAEIRIPKETLFSPAS